MDQTKNNSILWPELPYSNWKDTLDALHMKMQVIGKVKLALSPFLNQWWNTALHLNAAGLTTGLISSGNIIFEINIDFVLHKCIIKTSGNKIIEVPLMQCSVAEFYSDLMSALAGLGINVKINTLPAEVPEPVHCYEDTRRAYDKKYVSRWYQIILRSGMVFEKFRSSFRGKSSPVNFFWGSFDLSETRYSGKSAKPPEHGGQIMKYAENEENFAIGFWAGNTNYPKPAFYSYLYPAPKGIESVKIKPGAAAFNPTLGEFILDYNDVRKSADPEEMILDFLNSTYLESAKLAAWDIGSLKAEVPK
jgi:hypothetical protein